MNQIDRDLQRVADRLVSEAERRMDEVLFRLGVEEAQRKIGAAWAEVLDQEIAAAKLAELTPAQQMGYAYGQLLNGVEDMAKGIASGMAIARVGRG